MSEAAGIYVLDTSAWLTLIEDEAGADIVQGLLEKARAGEVIERPEAVEAGTVRLVGTDRERIVAEAVRLLEDTDAYERMARAVNPYGDGHAAERIAGALFGEPVMPVKPVGMFQVLS